MPKAKATRQYTKRDPNYWTRIKNPEAVVAKQVHPPHEGFASFDGKDHYSRIAACGGAGNNNSLRNQWAPVIAANNLYPNLSAGLMPFGVNGGYYTMSAPINLATLAYFNVPLVHNTINLLRDFSISPLHIRTSNKTVRTFFAKWFDAINLPDFMAQFFLEYYRSGNVFIYQFNGRIADDKFEKLKVSFSAAKSPELPIRFVILDPKQVYLQAGPNGDDSTYTRLLSTFELQRLRDPKTPEDKQVLRSLPPEVQKQIKNYSSQPWVYVPLDTNRLYWAFNSKQDYEPLAVPMIWPLLSRIEYKLMLEKMDMSLVQTMEQVFLLITAGNLADERNPGTNPKALENLRNMFQSQAIGRVLVADFTTKAEWKIPDLKELLGKGKYEQVDKDIREGLGYQFFGEEKFANAAIKAKIFVKSLNEGRRVFLDNFLRPQVKAICENMGFKTLPYLEFEEIDVEDQTAMNRVYVQMAQLGLLTDEELNIALKTGILPTKEESVEHQKKFKKERDEDLYFPLVGGDKGIDEQGRPSGGPGTKMPGKKVSPRKAGYQFSMKSLVEGVKPIAEAHAAVEKAYQKAYKLKKLDDSQANVAFLTARALVLNEPQEKWQELAAEYVKDPKPTPSEVLSELSGIAVEFADVCSKNPWTAVSLYRARAQETEPQEA